MYVKETAIVCIAAIEVYALSQGINGFLLTVVVGIIAGIAGYSIKGVVKNDK